jgi:hypothetical protein
MYDSSSLLLVRPLGWLGKETFGMDFGVCISMIKSGAFGLDVGACISIIRSGRIKKRAIFGQRKH